MAYKEPKTSKRADLELLTELDEWFRIDLDHPTWVAWRKNAVQCYQYKEGDQWSAKELKELEDRGQPATVNNQIAVTINRLVGQFVKIKTRIGYRGRNYPQDQAVADALTDTLLYIRQNNQLEFEEVALAEDGFTGGFGCLSTYVEFDDIGEPEIKVRHEDPFTIFPDAHSRRYDWNEDAQRVSRAKWMDLSEAKELWPEHGSEIGQMFNTDFVGTLGTVDGFKNENYVDAKARRVRPVETWYKKKSKETICLFSDGSIVDKQEMTLAPPNGEKRKITKKELSELREANDYREIDRLNHKMYAATFLGGLLLEHKEVDRKFFPFVPYFAYRKKNGEPYSLVGLSLSMQDAINKRESKALHLLNTNQAIFEAGAISDPVVLAKEKARPDGQMEINRGYFDKFGIRNNIELAVTQFNMHNQAKVDFRHITGINPDALGEPSEIRSGVGIARKTAMTDLIVAPLFDNFRRTRILLARNTLELIQKYLTEEKLFYIMDDLNAVRAIALNKRQEDGSVLNDVKQGLYDVVAEDMPDITTLQQEQFQLLAQALPQMLPFGPFWVKKLIQLSDIRHKEEFIKEIEAQSGPPPVEPRIAITAQLDNLTAPERAFFYDKMGSPELAKLVLEQNPPPTTVLKAEGDAQKEQGKAQAAMMKGQMDMAGKKMDMEHKREGHAMDMVARRDKLAMDRSKGQMDMRHKTAQVALKLASEANRGGE